MARALRPSLILITLLTLTLLLCSGDVEANPGPGRDLSICHINTRSLCPNDRSKRIDEIHSQLCLRDHYDVICISETWLHLDILDDAVDIPNYQLFRKDRPEGRGGGVAIYVHKSLPVKRRNDLEENNLELLLLELTSQQKRFILGCCYRPPGTNARDAQIFIDTFQIVVNNIIFDAPESLFLLGDFNDKCILWDDEHTGSELGRKLHNLVLTNNLFQIIQEPTHLTPHNISTLDLILTDSPGYILDSGIGAPLGDPYHCLIFCRIRVQTPKQNCYKRDIWEYKHGNYEGLNESLSTAPWDAMDIYDEIDEAAHYFKSLFLQTCKDFIPTKRITVRPRDEHWITNDVRRSFRKRNRAHKRWKRNPSDATFNHYTQAREETEACKQTAKDIYYSNLSRRLISPETGAKEYWKLTKELYGTKVKGGIPPLVKDDKVYSSPQDKCNILNTHFAKKSKLPNQLPHLPDVASDTNSTLETLHFTEEEVCKVIKGLDKSKATGPDSVSNTLLKRTAQAITRPLCSLFNKSLAWGKFPNDWKIAHLAPIFKSNNKQDPTNYRPISLLSNIGKLLERLVFIKLYEYCMMNNLLTWRNSAYKIGDSTINQLTYLVHRIYEALSQGQDVCFVSLDASAAFDRVWHDGLLYKLQKLGIKGALLIWIADYLSNRKQRVVIEGCHSDWTYIKSGVPQGSILGPLLFLIYTNDIVNNIESEIFLFADDTAILEPLSLGNLSIDKVNRDLVRLSNWASQWLVQFNPTKTKYLIFSKKTERQQYQPLFLQNKQLTEVDSHKHLGLVLNNTLTWDNHINKICTEAGRRIASIKRLPNNITPLTKLHIYCTFIRPVLEYGNVIFDNCTNRVSDELESIQRQAALAITRAYSHTTHVNLLRECGLQTLKDRRSQAKSILFFKIKKGKAPEYLQDLIPQEVGTANYNLRNSQDIRLPKTNKNYFLKSFIPSSIKAWNDLSENVRNIAEVDSFKLSLSKIYGKLETYKPYLQGQTAGHIHLSRIRMKLSGLNSHRKRHHFIDFSTCPNCGARLEDETHFFLFCTAYAAARRDMLASLGHMLPQYGGPLAHLETRKNQKEIIKIIINGTQKEQVDFEIFDIISVYIINTNRFNW